MRSYSKMMLLAGCVMALTGCVRSVTSTPDLEAWSKEVESRPAPPLETLPVLTKFEPVSYTAEARDPFNPASMRGESASSLRPNANRPKEVLEGFALDGLKMVGTMGERGGLSALIRAPDNVVYRVRAGQYLGQNDGRVVMVSSDRVDVIEVVTDGSGGWEERQAAVVLTE